MSEQSTDQTSEYQANLASLAGKLQTLYNGLTPGEQEAMTILMQQAAETATGEVGGYRASIGIVININTGGGGGGQFGGPRPCYIPMMSPGEFQSTLGRSALEPAPYVPSLTYVDGIAYS